MENKMVFEIKDEISETELAEFLSMFIQDECGFCSCDIENDEEYMKARERILRERKFRGEVEPRICYEDVWARVLFNGGALVLEENDEEGSGESERHRITLQDIIKGFKLYFKEKPATGCASVSELINTGDFWDVDCVMQYAAFGEVVYG